MNQVPSNPGHNPAVVHFLTAAKDYCRLLETELALPQREFIQQLLSVTLALYSAGLTLPEIEPDEDSDEDQFYGEDRAVSRQAIVDKLGSEFYYEKVFEPFDAEDCRPVTASLGDDLADMYGDLLKGLIQVPPHGAVPAHVIWQWKFDLQIHWGRHAVGAIAALHSLLFGSHAVS
jgi:hypothetical protein